MVCGPIELIMIQQQAKGGGLFSTAVSLMQAGPSTFFRGTLAMMAREGIYAGSFLGMMPVMREQFMQMYPDSIGKTEDSARFSNPNPATLTLTLTRTLTLTLTLTLIDTEV